MLTSELWRNIAIQREREKILELLLKTLQTVLHIQYRPIKTENVVKNNY